MKKNPFCIPDLALSLLLSFLTTISAQTAAPDPVKEIILEGLRRPWSMAFLNENEALILEKEGGLLRVNLTRREKFATQGFPTDIAEGVGVNRGDNAGKFEVLPDPDFKRNRWIYLSYAAQTEKGTGLKIIRARYQNDVLSEVKTIFTAAPFTSERHHYGGGMIFGADGKLYITAGERLFREIDEPALPIAQDLTDQRGKIYRLNPDGSIPADNPDFGKNAVPGLYAVGIRAAQGLALEPATRKIWFSEHGTMQGDEINILRAGANYGWPVMTTGKYRSENYHPPAMPDAKFTEPVWAWMHTVAPTGLVFYTGNEFPAWKNNLIVPGLSRGSLWRLRLDGEVVVSAEELFTHDRVRARKVAQSPAGRLYLLTDDDNGKLIRIRQK